MSTKMNGDHQVELIYECPHCGHQVGVDEGVIGKVIDCPDCDNPFEVPTPEAKFINPRLANVEATHPHVATPATDETELIKTHPAMFGNHPLSFIGLALGTAAAAIAAIWAFYVGSYSWGITATVLTGIGAIAFFAWRVNLLCTTLTVTSKRTIVRRGLISKSTSEVQHDDVRNIKFDQSVVQRFLGVGHLAISSSGQDDMEITINGIPDPEEIVNLVRDHQ